MFSLFSIVIYFLTFSYNKELAQANQIEIPVLMYHHFDANYTSSTTIKPSSFKEQLIALKNNGYQTISIKELHDFYYNQTPLPEKPILITMDDGYMSNYTYAYPHLKALDMKATIFVIAGRLIHEGEEDPYSIERLTWEKAKEMYESGLIDIQSHTLNLHHKTETTLSTKERSTLVSPNKLRGGFETMEAYKSRVSNDLTQSISLIEEKIGNNVIAFTYPYGDFSNESETIVKESGFKFSFTVKPGINTENSSPFLLKRINVPHGVSGEALLHSIKHAP